VGWKKPTKQDAEQSRRLAAKTFGPAKPLRQAPGFIQDNPDRARRFAKLEEMKAQGRVQ
jgi:hypothetical protein